MELELEPHEQLDEIDLRTNSDGTVEVKILDWEKRDGFNEALVTFRTPTGDEVGEVMAWPESKISEYKFIRFIEATPYTLRTAEGINEDDDLWLDAKKENREWRLHLPEQPSLLTRLRGVLPQDDFGWTLIKVAMWPITVVGLVGMFMSHDMAYVPLRGDEFTNSPFANQEHLDNAMNAVKYSVITFTWFLIFVALL